LLKKGSNKTQKKALSTKGLEEYFDVGGGITDHIFCEEKKKMEPANNFYSVGSEKKSDRSIEDYHALFYRGNYADVVALTIDAHPSKVPGGIEAIVIGSLGNVGRVNEARHLFDRLNASLSLQEQVAARYHLGVTFTRHSLYMEAVKSFTANLLQARKSKDPTIQFYAFMGLGFYRFFCAHFNRCILAAEKSLLGALDAGFTYGKYQAYELLGHAKVNAGLVSEGIADIRKAEHLASAFGNGSIQEAFRIARACYEVQFGLQTQEELGRLLDATPPQNTYSRATLLLELSRISTLRGKVSEAQNYLNQASRIIYENRHRRYGSYLNFRYAYHAYLSGKFEEALNLLRAAQSSVHEGIDLLLAVKIFDLELKVRKQIDLDSEQNKAIEAKVATLSRKAGHSVANRILARRHSPACPLKMGPGEDRIGDILDKQEIDSLFGSGYLTPLRERLNIPFGKRFVVLDATGDLSLLVDYADMRTLSGLTKQLQTLLLALSLGTQSKESLIAKIWGYKKYDPLRHDPILFQSIARLRHLLGPQREWVTFL
jgi:hypothetical protein